MAEVARHAQLDGVAALLLARAEPAAGGDRRRQRDAEERGEGSHGTATRSAKERTRPSFSATSRWPPAGSASRVAAVRRGERADGSGAHGGALDRHAASLVVVAADGHVDRARLCLRGEGERALAAALLQPAVEPGHSLAPASAGRGRRARSGRRRRQWRRGGRPCRPSRSGRGCARLRSTARTGLRSHARARSMSRSRAGRAGRPCCGRAPRARFPRRPRSGAPPTRTRTCFAATVRATASPSRNTTSCSTFGAAPAAGDAASSAARQPNARAREAHGDGATASSSTVPPPSVRRTSECEPGASLGLVQMTLRCGERPAQPDRLALAVDRHAAGGRPSGACGRRA